MKNIILCITFVVTFFFKLVAQEKQLPFVREQIDKYNVCWTTQSQNSSQSMPLGGGDIGLNVWVEDGDILFYISRSGTFDENNQFLKLGRGRIRLSPNILKEEDCKFNQELKLYDGYVSITGKKGDNRVDINLWVDVFSPVINIKINSKKKVNATVFYENWRTEKKEIPQKERHACFSYSGYPGKVYTYPDSVRYEGNNIVWFHRNRNDKLLFDFCVRQQGLESVKEKMVDTQRNLTFGGIFYGKDMVPYKTGDGKYVDTPYAYKSVKSKKPSKNHEVKIILHTAQSEILKKWEKDLFSSNVSFNNKKDWKETKKWWHNFWNRSYIFINNSDCDTSDLGWQVGRNYQLFRYQLGCNAYGSYPTKFNGGLFTFDPVFVKQFTELNHGTPDYRSWGGGSFTAQNQRLVYWAMLKAGDFDMMPSQFNFYNRVLRNAELRTKVYWQHDGCCFTEQIENFGLPFAGGWGFEEGPRKRGKDVPFGEQANKWVKHHYTTQLEFAFMILKYHQYSGIDISEYLSFIKSSVNFFFEHYIYRNKKRTGNDYDKNGKLVIYPSTAAETYKYIKNPTDLCAALHAVTKAICKLPDNYLSNKERQQWKNKLKRIPELSYGYEKGHRIITPGDSLPPPINSEIMQLYPVFPYELYGIGRPDIQTAINTWKYGKFARNYISWHQDGIFCARMGITDEAKRISILKLKNSPRRFPTFWGPGHDYVPDHNWGGSGMIGLQDMLLQTVKENVYLLPAWPDDWNVTFKLHAPDKIIISGEVENGKVKDVDINSKNSKIRLNIKESFKN